MLLAQFVPVAGEDVPLQPGKHRAHLRGQAGALQKRILVGHVEGGFGKSRPLQRISAPTVVEVIEFIGALPSRSTVPDRMTASAPYELSSVNKTIVCAALSKLPMTALSSGEKIGAIVVHLRLKPGIASAHKFKIGRFGRKRLLVFHILELADPPRYRPPWPAGGRFCTAVFGGSPGGPHTEGSGTRSLLE